MTLSIAWRRRDVSRKYSFASFVGMSWCLAMTSCRREKSAQDHGVEHLKLNPTSGLVIRLQVMHQSLRSVPKIRMCEAPCFPLSTGQMTLMQAWSASAFGAARPAAYEDNQAAVLLQYVSRFVLSKRYFALVTSLCLSLWWVWVFSSIHGLKWLSCQPEIASIHRAFPHNAGLVHVVRDGRGLLPEVPVLAKLLRNLRVVYPLMEAAFVRQP